MMKTEVAPHALSVVAQAFSLWVFSNATMSSDRRLTEASQPGIFRATARKASGFGRAPFNRASVSPPLDDDFRPSGSYRGARQQALSGGFQVRRYRARKPVMISSRAARLAGSRPPAAPINKENANPASMTCGETWKLKVSVLKVR